MTQSSRLSLRFMLLFVAGGLAAFPGVVGNIAVDNYSTYTGAGMGDLSGATIQAHYNITDPAALAACCDTSDLRWMQLVVSSSATGFTPNPNRPFIDPRQGQDIGGGQTGDNLPYYDVTFANAAGTGGINRGVGPYMEDMPAVLNSRATPGMPYTFMADTVLVCIYDSTANPQQLVILGGFQWGFTITATNPGPTYQSTPLPLTPLSDSAALRNMFNTALNLDFPGYQVVDSTMTTCNGCTFQLAPEPQTLSLFLPGMGLIVLLARRVLRCARS